MKTIPACLQACLAATLLSTARAETISAKDIHPERELLITAPAIVDSPAAKYPGAWSFGKLMEELVGEKEAGPCVREWLETWLRLRTVNDQLVFPRPAIEQKIILPWKKRDGYDPSLGEPWIPKMANAPFRLLAIVNRMDLAASDLAKQREIVQAKWRRVGREKQFLNLLAEAGSLPATATDPQPVNGGYGWGGGVTARPSVGEGRFVFGAVDREGQPLEGGWTVILEYRLPLDTKTTPAEWAASWHTLSDFDPAGDQFAPLLEQITDAFAKRLPNNGTPPILAQLRTSEAAFGVDREFRQFVLKEKFLVPAPLTLTPGPAFAIPHSPEQRILTAFLRDQNDLLRDGISGLPASFPIARKTVPIQAGSAFILVNQPSFYWEGGSGISRDARRLFSLNTCNGCHAGETACGDGMHVHPRAEGMPAQISAFLRTDGQPHKVTDPATPHTEIAYQEMNDRAALFAALLDPRDRTRLETLRDLLHDRLQRAH